MLLLVTAKPAPEHFYYATAQTCASRKTTPKRPIAGRISWNTASVNKFMTNSGFQFGVRIGIHQIMHILGFSKELFKDWNPKIT